MKHYAPWIKLEFAATNSTVTVIAKKLRKFLIHVGFPKMNWRITEEGEAKIYGFDSFDQWLDNPLNLDLSNVNFNAGHDVDGRISYNNNKHTTLSLRVFSEWFDSDGDGVPTDIALNRCSEIIKLFSNDFILLKNLLLVRQGVSGLDCIPRVPLVFEHSHAIAASSNEILENYETLEGFYAAWEKKHEVNSQIILFRGLNYESQEDYLTYLFKSQWSMARVAKPNKTQYSEFKVAYFEDEIFQSGEISIRPVGYVEPQKTFEFTCVPSENQFINGWEIFKLYKIITDKTLEDGGKVETIRIVFIDEKTAVANKRPLLDIGAEVCFMNNNGVPSFLTN